MLRPSCSAFRTFVLFRGYMGLCLGLNRNTGKENETTLLSITGLHRA